MPLFDFKCQNPDCNHVFETVVPRDTVEKECPECGKRAEKLLSAGQRFLFNWFED